MEMEWDVKEKRSWKLSLQCRLITKQQFHSSRHYQQTEGLLYENCVQLLLLDQDPVRNYSFFCTILSNVAPGF